MPSWTHPVLQRGYEAGSPLVVAWLRQQKDADDVVESLSYFPWKCKARPFVWLLGI
jgi:hypothetical protein